MSNLTNGQRNFLHLIGRTPQADDGWRKVSEPCCALFGPKNPQKAPPELYEFEKLESGGRVRLTERGSVLLDYV